MGTLQGRQLTYKSIRLISFLFSIFFLFYTFLDVTATKAHSQDRADFDFFTSLILDSKELAGVKAALDNKNLGLAKQLFVRYMKSQSTLKSYFDVKKEDSSKTTAKKKELLNRADRYAQNELISVGIWHKFGDNIDWTLNPTINEYKEWTWQLNRHKFWSELGHAYKETGNEKYALAFVSQMRDWVKDNPKPRLRSNHRGSPWRTIDAGIRMSIAWPTSFYSFLSSQNFTDDDIILMLKSFLDHAHYLLKYPSKSGNWLIHEMKGLYYIGALFPEFKESKLWRDAALDFFSSSLSEQVYPDGSQFELSSTYHQITLQNFSDIVKIARFTNHPLPSDYINRLENMFNYTQYASMPNGRLPALNDGSYTDIRDLLLEGYSYINHRTDFLWVGSSGSKGNPPKDISIVFPYAGQLVMRSGWDVNARYLLFDAGPFGYGHQHEDKLNFVIHAYGRNMVIDPGNYPYDDSVWRHYVTGSYAHNVIHVDGMDQHRRGLERAKYIVKSPLPFAWKDYNNFVYASAAFGILADEGYGPSRKKTVIHTRRILYVKESAPAMNDDYWLIADILEPSDGALHRYESFFHLDFEDISVDAPSNYISSLSTSSSNLSIIPADNITLTSRLVKGQVDPVVQGWSQGDKYAMRPIPTVIFEQATKGLAYFIYAFHPTPAGNKSVIKSVHAEKLSPHEIVIKVLFPDTRVDYLKIGTEPSVLRTTE